MPSHLCVPLSGLPASYENHDASPAWDAEGAQLIDRASLSPQEWADLEHAAYLHSAAPESYDIVGSSSSLLRTPCRLGTVSVLPDGRYWHVAGGLIADERLKPQIIQWLKQISRQQRRTIAIYSVPAADADSYREAGYSVNKFGEEPVIELGQLDWKGGAFEWVRRQSNFCHRAGLVIEEIKCPLAQREMSADLVEILSDDLSERVYSRPLRLLEGEFDPHVMHRRRLFVARQKDTGRIEGFLAASPMNGGQVWAFETYRKRRSAPRGTIPFLFRHVIDQLQSEGVQRVSLCLVPGKGVHLDRSANTSSLVRWILGFWYKNLNLIFNTAGQDFFKSRFRPAYVDRYLCVYPHNSLLSVASFLKTSGAHLPNVRNLTRKLCTRQTSQPPSGD